jgi:predicted XRE-type DNA-binding protein
MPSDWKDLSSVGPGVCEIRVHTGIEHRIFYVAKFSQAIYVLHAFQKKTRRTRADASKWPDAATQDSSPSEEESEEEAMATRIRRSAGNVFRDLGFPREEAEHLRIRSDLMIRLSRLIEARGLTQAQAARLLGVTQPRISDLVRGKIDRFSGDSLIELLGLTGARIDIVVKPRRRVA